MTHLLKIAGFAAGMFAYFLNGTQDLLAQNICSEAVVYFDSGKADITPTSREKLDSLLQRWAGREVLLELEGHTDNVNDLDYNQILSEKRIASVKHYLESGRRARLTVREFGRSETKPVASNNTEEGKAQNRRVIIKYVSLENGKVKLGATADAQVSFPADALGDCSVCGSSYKAKYYENDDEIGASGWGMVTTSGQQLTSGGMMSFATGCRDKKAKETPFPACFEFPITSKEPEFKGWITNATGAWEEVPLTVEGDMAKICIPNYQWGRGVNYDCPVVPEYVFSDSSNLKSIRSTLVHTALRGHTVSYLPNVVYNSDSLAKAVYTSLAVDDENTLWVCNRPIKTMEIKPEKNSLCKPFHPFTATLAHYRPIIFSDTVQVLKVPAKYDIATMEYYIKDADTAFAFQRIGKRKFEAPILFYGHMLKLHSSTGKTYSVHRNARHLKYNKKRQCMVGKIRKL